MRPFAILILSIFLLTATACRKEKEPVFTLPQRAYLGNELRTDGYWVWGNNTTTYSSHSFILYRNGVVLFNNDDTIPTQQFFNFTRSDRESWGLFIVDSNQLIRETFQYHPSYFSRPTSSISKITVQIDNDTTLRFLGKGVGGQKDLIYKFVPFHPKPDSTNDFFLE